MTDGARDAAGSPAEALAALHTAGTLMERMGIEVVSCTADELTATMPVEGNRQPYGLLHGGASCVLVETLGSYGAALHAATLGMRAVGTEISVSHHRAVASGSVTARAVPLHRGRSLATFEVVVADEQGRRVATGRITCTLVPGA